MNTSGEVADLMVKEAIQITESATKLAGLGAKNLAAIVIALINDDTKLQGKTNLKNLLKTGKPLCILQIKEDDLKAFTKAANDYGVLFTAVTDKNNNTGLCDIIAKNDDVSKLNYIMDKLGYTAPDIDEPEPEKDDTSKAPDKDGEDKSKNQYPRARENQQESEFTKHGDMERTDSGIKERPSVKKKVEDIKEQLNNNRAIKAPEKEKKPTEHTPPKPNKKKKHKKKGKSR